MVTKQKLDDDTQRVVEEENEARQGVELHAMRYVLAISTIGAMVILGIIWFVFYAT